MSWNDEATLAKVREAEAAGAKPTTKARSAADFKWKAPNQRWKRSEEERNALKVEQRDRVYESTERFMRAVLRTSESAEGEHRIGDPMLKAFIQGLSETRAAGADVLQLTKVVAASTAALITSMTAACQLLAVDEDKVETKEEQEAAMAYLREQVHGKVCEFSKIVHDAAHHVETILMAGIRLAPEGEQREGEVKV